MKCHECGTEVIKDFDIGFRCSDCSKVFCVKHEAFEGAGVCSTCNALRQ